ncbi:hypothetical protein F8271_04060 [Micromonospora sp. ALFpr18c]|uniref:hypothetical protein n=1 Tax=unclassified Micromonospora TaxID=2617518 RepID=UPI00124B27A3|nr:hypothetical protein [Micromonospora sp. ALFpr18c]KAB1947704.1 hypothetical protein F8271_04060 [Micromonospora sp. ALFpr18c]
MIEELIKRAAAEDDDAMEKLCEIAAADPRRLVPHHQLLLDLDLWWPATLYRAADAGVVRRVIERIDDGQSTDDLNNLLLILAHTAHPLAESALRRWSTHPPAGADQLHVGALSYALEGGWTLDPTGDRRDLCGDTAYRLVLRDEPRRVGGPTCPWCAAPLWVAADLDTTEPAIGAALAHTRWSGRLVFETCHNCACYTTLYSQVTPGGGATWWAGNTRPSYLPPETAVPEDPPTQTSVPGPALASPYQSSAWDRGGSTLGGRPDWIQDAEHPDCPDCGQPMDYVGLIGGADLDDLGEGAYYLHLHQPCGFTAVNYQQS